MNIVQKSLTYDRSAYPFVPSDGVRTPFTDAVDDMVIYTPAGATLPMTAYVSQADPLTITIDGVNFICKATLGSCNILNEEGALSGYISWNQKCADILSAIYKAGDVEPTDDVYVDISVCVPYVYPSLSNVTINGEPVNGNIIRIDAGDSINVSDNDDQVSIDLKHNSTYVDKSFTAIKFVNIGTSKDTRWYGFVPTDPKVVENSDGTTEVTIDIPKHCVLLNSAPECDLRVITSSDGIVLSEVSNDKL